MLADWFTRQPWLRIALYTVIVGGLVGDSDVALAHFARRAQGLSLLATIAWISGLGWLEGHVGMRFDLFEHEHWDYEWLDLARWIGWIPLVIAIDRAFRVKAADTR